MIDLATILSAFAVGAVVGFTGIGGGALMTPLLVLVFGVAPQTAVGTDLLFASVTKVFGVLVHGRHGGVDWQIVRRLMSGSLPVALLTVVMLGYSGQPNGRGGVILPALACALFLTAAGLILRNQLHEVGKRLRTRDPGRFRRLQPGLTVLAGAVVGLLVALTSIGAGALGTVALVYLYPFRLSGAKLVGTDLAHAIPLALVAGAGHLVLGNVDLYLLATLLLGSVPGILVGSMLSFRVSESVVHNAIAAVLIVAASKLVW